MAGSILEDEIATVEARCMDDLMNNYRRAVVPWGKLLNYLPTKTTRKLGRARLRDMRAMPGGSDDMSAAEGTGGACHPITNRRAICFRR